MFILFSFIVMRMSGAVFFNPILGRSNIPGAVKTAFVFMLSLMMYMGIGGKLQHEPQSLLEFGFLLITELAFGFVIGFCMELTVLVIRFASSVMDFGMGSFFSLPVLRLQGNAQIESLLAGLRRRYPGFQAIATTAHRQKPVYEQQLGGPCIVFIGNETDGLCHSLYELADLSVSIPMAEGACASSFNVSCAATVILYEIIRQRSAGNQRSADNQRSAGTAAEKAE